jgi:hypothetical protein
MMPGMRLKRMQTLPKQRNPSVGGKKYKRQQFPGRESHGMNRHCKPRDDLPASDIP